MLLFFRRHAKPTPIFKPPTTWRPKRFLSLVTSDAQKRTIYALSTPPGKAGVAVLRVSGPDVLRVFKEVVRPVGANSKLTADLKKGRPTPWRMYHCEIKHPNKKDETLDRGLAVYFAAPKSFTTEDVLELHIHSGRAVVASVLSALSALSYCRPAEAGEFTRRAFNGGRLDLTEVEGLKDLIDAETDVQRRAALHGVEGKTRVQFEGLRKQAIDVLAMVEALIDFGEGEDIEEGVFEHARHLATELRNTIQSHLQDRRRGEIIRSGIRLAIFGPPNAGKSTLLNFLAQRDAAIVTSVPGTTRDILELSLDLDGVPLIIADTAGIRATDDFVESIGIERAKAASQTADISLCVLSLPDVTSNSASNPRIEIPPTVASLVRPDTVFLLNKSDLASYSRNHVLEVNNQKCEAWSVSLTTGAGCAEFLSQLSRTLRARYDLGETSHNSPLITRQRHRVHLETAVRFLDAFLLTNPQDVVLGAEELRYAAQSIGKVSGLIDTEDVLDVVFQEFCIGK